MLLSCDSQKTEIKSKWDYFTSYTNTNRHFERSVTPSLFLFNINNGNAGKINDGRFYCKILHLSERNLTCRQSSTSKTIRKTQTDLMGWTLLFTDTLLADCTDSVSARFIFSLVQSIQRRKSKTISDQTNPLIRLRLNIIIKHHPQFSGRKWETLQMFVV